VEDVRTTTIEQLTADLRANGPHVTEALHGELQRTYGRATDLSRIEIGIHQIDATDFKVEANLVSLLKLSEQDSHDVIARGLLAVAGLNQRLRNGTLFELGEL
jgi:hypothetical protein